MKTLFTLLLISSFWTLQGQAQTPTPPKVTLTWVDNINVGVTYNVKRSAGNPAAVGTSTDPCTGVVPSTVIKTGLTGLTYVDNNPGVNVWCYGIEAALNGLTSNLSNVASAVVKPASVVLGPATVAFVFNGIKATVTYSAALKGQ